MKEDKFPFKAGQLVESRSFIRGYRGSWFRSKVIEIGWKKSSLWCKLEYIDFPDEKIKWTKLYQKPPISKGRMKDVHKELMIRPPYPHIYQEDNINDSKKNPEVVVIVGNNWMVGDLVDWWADDVYWCGEVIQLLEGDKAIFKLPDPPIGEGETYDVQFKDLRPTLCWSPEQGWVVPINQVVGNHRCCGRLVQPTIRVEQTTLQEQNDVQISMSEFNIPPSPLAPLSSLPSPKMSECHPANLLQHQKLNECYSGQASYGRHAPVPSPHMSEHHTANCLQKQKPNECDSVEACHGKHASTGLNGNTTIKPNQLEGVPDPIFRVISDNVFKAGDGKEIEDGGARKRIKVGEVYCSLESSDTIEASVMELEELACKVRWLRMVLDHGSQMVNTQSSWKFVENRVTAAPKV